MISGIFKRLKLTKDQSIQQTRVYNKISQLFEKLTDLLKLVNQQQKNQLYNDLNQLQRTAQLSQGKVLNLIEKYEQNNEQKNIDQVNIKMQRIQVIKQVISDTVFNLIKRAMGYKQIKEQISGQLDETAYCLDNNYVIDQQQKE